MSQFPNDEPSIHNRDYDSQFQSAIQEEKSNFTWIIFAIGGTLIAGILSGILVAIPFIDTGGWFSLEALMLMMAAAGFVVGSVTTKLAGRKSLFVGLIAILGCAAVILMWNYTSLYWYSRDVVSSPFDLRLIQYLVSTSQLWQLEDIVWFVLSSIVAFVIGAREFPQTT